MLLFMKFKFLALSLILLLSFSGCGTNKSMSASKTEAIMPAKISKTVNGVTVTVDPMIEMLSVIQYLSNFDEQFGELTEQKTSYHDDLETAFREFENHEAVKFINTAMRQGFSFDSPPTACLYLDEKFSVSSEFEGSDYQRNRLTINMEDFRNIMEQFFIDTNFEEFYLSHQDFYNRMIDAYVEEFPQWNMIDAMESFYGKEMAGYTIVLVALFHPGGFGPTLEVADGRYVYSIQGPLESENDTPLFGNSDAIAYLIVHEFGHSFIPINEEDNSAMIAEIQRSKYLMEAIRVEMNRYAYINWSIAYEELVLRAAGIYIMKENTTIDPEALLQSERDIGFIYIDAAYEAVLQYSQNMEQYSTFDDFIPVITDALLNAYPSLQ